MTTTGKTPLHASVTAHREALKQAYESGDTKRICFAMSDLGLAFFKIREYKEGLEMLDEAIDLASDLGDFQIQARSLGIKVLAYQEVDRLPDAYSTANLILELADHHGDHGVKCDALANQARILLDSGEPEQAEERLVEARKAAEISGDKRRLMNVMGVFGHIALAKTNADQAFRYFDKAVKLARELNDQAAEYGYEGNKGIVLTWLGEHAEAIEVFERILPYVRERGETFAEVGALRHLANAYFTLGNTEKTLEVTQQGISLARGIDDEALYAFYKWQTIVSFRIGEVEQARELTQQMIELANQSNDSRRKIDTMLTLAESFTLADMPENALACYQDTLKVAEAAERTIDQAYLIGRIGMTLGEMGRLEEAITYHQNAIKLAEAGALKHLEGEQYCMLAMAYLDQQNTAQAVASCQQALDLFEAANLPEEAQNARQLLAQITDSQ